MPTINCTEFNESLAAAVERREPVDSPKLREHAASCAGCQALWLDALLVDGAVAQWKRPSVPAALTERVLAYVADQSSVSEPAQTEAAEVTVIKPARDISTPATGTPRFNRRAALATTALAVCVCAMLLLSRSPSRPQIVKHVRPDGSSVGANTVNANNAIQSNTMAKSNTATKSNTLTKIGATTSTPAPQRTVKPAPGKSAGPSRDEPVELLMVDAGSAYLHLADKAAKAVAAASVLVPPADAAPTSTPAPQDDEGWTDDVRREIAPVTNQLGHAFEFLLQAVPTKRAPAT